MGTGVHAGTHYFVTTNLWYSALHPFSPNKYSLHPAEQIDGVAGGDHNIRLFPGSQGAQGIVDPCDLGRVDGDGGQGSLRRHSSFYRQRGTQRQVLDGNFRVICADGRLYSCLLYTSSWSVWWIRPRPRGAWMSMRAT